MYTALEVAIYVVNWCHDKEIAITNLKLQKLLYFLQGENCRLRHNRLIKDDFYAWQHGPVIPELYNTFAIFSSSAIPTIKQEVNILEEDQALIDNMLAKYAGIATWGLVELSHKQDPWKYNHQIFGDKAIIPYESIEAYFVEE